MGKPGYYIAKETFESNGLKVIQVDTDEGGINTDQVKEILKKQKIKMVYVTPHHDYPTTVTMPAERRLELLDMAANYSFFILEDDYDFDFQYDRSPILPIASIDQLKYVIYVGGFSKSFAPAMRIGFMLADPGILESAGKWRKIIDRQGDTIQELAFDRLMKREVISSTIRKVRKIYHSRRDFAYQLFQEHLEPYISTNLPNGGLAFWVKLNLSPKQIEDLLYNAKQKGVFLLDPKRYKELPQDFTRMGFASMNEEELVKAVKIVKECLR
jgi:GntR family transcriptional regulator/MocR family aminotransferase